MQGKTNSLLLLVPQPVAVPVVPAIVKENLVRCVREAVNGLFLST